MSVRCYGVYVDVSYSLESLGKDTTVRIHPVELCELSDQMVKLYHLCATGLLSKLQSLDANVDCCWTGTVSQTHRCVWKDLDACHPSVHQKDLQVPPCEALALPLTHVIQQCQIRSAVPGRASTCHPYLWLEVLHGFGWCNSEYGLHFLVVKSHSSCWWNWHDSLVSGMFATKAAATLASGWRIVASRHDVDLLCSVGPWAWKFEFSVYIWTGYGMRRINSKEKNIY